MMIRKTDNPENQEYWDFIDRTAKKAEEYPAWKRGGDSVPINLSSSNENDSKRSSETLKDDSKIDLI